MSVVCHLAAELGINHRPGEFPKGDSVLSRMSEKQDSIKAKRCAKEKKTKPYSTVLYALFLPNSFPRTATLKKKFPCGDVLFQGRCVTVRGI
jgi:hypothetical protein